MGFWDDLVDAVEDVGGVIVDIGETVVDTVVDAGSAAVDAVTTVAAPVFDVGMDLLSPVFGVGQTIIDIATDPMGAVEWVGDVITDPVGALSDAVDSVVDFGLDLGQDVGGVFVGAGQAAYGLAGDALDTGLGLVGSAGGVIGGVVGAAGGLIDATTGGLATDALDFVDDEVLDRIDSITQGVIDLDFDDGAFTASVGVDNLLDVGVGISGDGVTATADAPFLGVDVGLTGSDGATVLLDENIPGWDLPLDSKVGIGVSADGGAGVIARVDDLRGITVNIVGDYDADLDYDQVKALSGSARTAPEAGPDAGVPGEVFVDDGPVEAMAVFAPEPMVFEPEPPSAIADTIAQTDQIESSLDDLWEDI